MVGCTQGEMVGRYDGPAGSENVGNCKGGAQVCSPDGSGFGPCTGEVLPSFEDCVTPVDEDCDGLTPVCGPGWTQGGGAGAAPVDLLPIGMAVDHSGGVVILGVLHGTADLGGGVVLSAPNKVDIALLRHDVAGKLLWTKHFPNDSTIAWALGGSPSTGMTSSSRAPSRGSSISEKARFRRPARSLPRSTRQAT